MDAEGPIIMRVLGEAPGRGRILVLALLCAMLGALALAATPALAVRGHVFEKSFGQEGTGPGEFEEPEGVAVSEATGDVYVADKENERVQRFSSEGVFIAAYPGPGGFLEGIAIDNSCHVKKLSGSACTSADPSNEDYYVVNEGSAIDKYSPTGTLIGTLTEAGSESLSGITGVAVDAEGKLWVAYRGSPAEQHVAHFSNALSNTFTAGCTTDAYVPSFELDNNSPGLAVDPRDNFYLNLSSASKARDAKFDSNCKPLINPVEEVEPDFGISAVAIDLSTGEPYIDKRETIARLTPEGALLETFGAGHLEEGRGVAVNASSGAVYVVEGFPSMSVGVAIFAAEPTALPRVEAESVYGVADTSATFEATVNPRSASGEPSTKYRFEYGPCASPVTCATSPYEASVPSPDGTLPADFEPHSFSAHVQGLSPHTVYHFRVVAENSHPGAAEGEGAFTTQSVGGELQLLDGRQWEMVSPPDKHAAILSSLNLPGLIQAAANGDALTYTAAWNAPEPQPQGLGSGTVQNLARRGAGSWSSKDIATSNTEPTGGAVNSFKEYGFFSPDLSLALAEPVGPFSPIERCSPSGACSSEVFPPVSERSVYLRHNLTCESEPASCYEPLVTGAEGYADVPPGTKFGGSKYEVGTVRILGATPDASHVLLRSGAALTEEPFEAGRPPAEERAALYEWSASKPPAERLQLVSVLPAAEGGKGVGGVDFGVDRAGSNARNAISSDGTRVFWTDQLNEHEHLYMRDLAKKETVLLDAPKPGAGSGKVKPDFQIASADGSRAYFTDEQDLTGQSGGGRDLYECRIVEEAGTGKDKCELSDLTPGAGQVGNLIPGAGEDGSDVYFVASGVLSGQPSAGGETPVAEAPNLYMLHYDSATEAWESPRLVAVLGAEDRSDWFGFGTIGHEAAEATQVAQTTARVSPSGRYLAFLSNRPLTGYDTRDAVSGKPDEEVYLYDSATRKLVCASCNPTGARPVGAETGPKAGNVDNKLEAGTWFAGIVPGWSEFEGTNNRTLHQPRYLSDEGRLFFDSADALVPQDVNGAIDVYEYEPPGVPAGGEHPCTTSSATYSERSGGCIGLVSSGTSDEESAFIDASESGGDAFFLTAAKLAPQDVDTVFDVYDAHECSAHAPCFPAPAVPPPPCTTSDSCRAAPGAQPPLFGSPPSATFSGAGNLVPSISKPAVKPLTRAQKLSRALSSCRKKYKRSRTRRARCERTAHHQYGASKSRKANAIKRGGN